MRRRSRRFPATRPAPSAGSTEFLQRYPDSSLADDAGLELGRIALERGDKDAALARFRGVVTQHEDGDRSDSARVELAALEAERGRREVAASTLGRARISKLPPSERRTAYRLLAAIAPDPVASLRWLARLRAEEIDPQLIARLDVELDAALGALSAADLDRAAEQLGDAIPAGRALARRAELALQQGDVEGARRAWEAARRRDLTAADSARVAALGERIELAEHGAGDAGFVPTFDQAAKVAPPDTAAATGTIGVVLPLSGPFARYGEETLQGIELAAGIFGGPASAQSGPGVKLLIRDTAGRPELAAEAVRALAANSSVSAIIGPMLSGESEAAAAAAEAAGVPLARALLAGGDRAWPPVRVPAAHDSAAGDRHARRALRARSRRAALRHPVSTRPLRPRCPQALLGSRRASGRPHRGGLGL